MNGGGGGWGAGNSYYGLYGTAPPKRGTSFMLQVYERVGISKVEVNERVGKSLIKVFKRLKLLKRVGSVNKLICNQSIITKGTYKKSFD